MAHMTAPASLRSLLRPVARLALPVIATNLLQTLVNVVDVFMAGRLGAIPVAAVGFASSVALLVILVAQMVTAGGMALAAQARGANDDDELAEVARQTLLLGVLAAVAIGALGWFAAHPLLAFMNSSGDPQAVTLGVGYLRILFLGTAALFVNLGLASLWQGAGDTVTPLLLGGGVNLLNVVFDYLFMFGPGPLPALGVPGAGLGTVAAWSVGAAIGLILFLRGRTVLRRGRGRLRPDVQRFRTILAIGMPAGLQGLAYALSRLVLLRVVTSTPAGTLGAAALAIGIQIESLAYMPGVALSVAATSLVGRALGAWQVAQAWRRAHAALFVGLAVMSSVGLVLLLGAPLWIELFEPSGNAVVVRAGISYLRINALAQPVLAVFMVLSGALRGAGDTRPALWGTFAGRWLVTLPMAWLLALRTPLGVDGAWWAMAAGTLVQAAWVAQRWFAGAWPEVALSRQPLFRRHLVGLAREPRERFLEGVRRPLLAVPGSREVVDPEGATYLIPGRARVQVSFRPGPHILEGLDTLQHVGGREVAGGSGHGPAGGPPARVGAPGSRSPERPPP
jgi:putative MATE family efflux protein